MTDALVLEGVCKRYGAFTAVDDLGFSAAPGRILGFLGPNGAGKTTTLRMILGLVTPDSGRGTPFRLAKKAMASSGVIRR